MVLIVLCPLLASFQMVAVDVSEETKIYPIAIVGAGAAGTMGVIRATFDNHEVILFTGDKQDQKRSCGHWVKKVDNMPSLKRYKKPIREMRDETLAGLKGSPLGYNLSVVEDSVASIEKQNDIFVLTDKAGHTYFARYVLLATGIMKEQPLIQGTIRPILKYANTQSIGYCSLCDGHRCFQKKTVVIGHTDDAADMALFLAEKYSLESMTVLTNGKSPEFTPSSIEEMDNHRITIIEEPILEIIGGDVLEGFKFETGQRVDAEICFVVLGLRPNNHLALQLGAETSDCGLVVTNLEGESSIPNLFVIGDLRAGCYKQIYTAWQHAIESLAVIDERLNATR